MVGATTASVPDGAILEVVGIAPAIVVLVVPVVPVVLVVVIIAGSRVVDEAPGVSGTTVVGVAFAGPAGRVVPDGGIVEVVGEVGPGGVNDPRTAERTASK